jgi:dTDP-4-amino-4,6-dideoxygalactose transaminase
MFGNKPGWIVSVLIALAMGGLIWKLGTLPPTTPPSGMFDAYLLSPIELPVTERLAREVLTLPCHPGMTDEEVLHVVAACNGFRG